MTGRLVNILAGLSTVALALTPALISTQQTSGNTRPSQAQSSRVAKVVVDVEGMFCESCDQTIHAMLMRTAGVKRATVSVKNKSATVLYDASRTNPAAIVSTISRLGYTARVARKKPPAA